MQLFTYCCVCVGQSDKVAAGFIGLVVGLFIICIFATCCAMIVCVIEKIRGGKGKDNKEDR